MTSDLANHSTRTVCGFYKVPAGALSWLRENVSGSAAAAEILIASKDIGKGEKPFSEPKVLPDHFQVWAVKDYKNDFFFHVYWNDGKVIYSTQVSLEQTKEPAAAPVIESAYDYEKMGWGCCGS